MKLRKNFDTALRTLPAQLQEGWVIANHILVSFHVAFISSVLVLPHAAGLKTDVLRFIFTSPETVVSAFFMYISFHTGIAVHEMGHFLTAARLNALSEALVERVRQQLEKPLSQRLLYYARVFLLAPYGRAEGIKREALNYYPDAPYNLAVSAAGPRASRNLAWAALPPAVLLIGIGLQLDAVPAIYGGRLLLGIGLVALLDFFLADRGKYREFREREARAREAAAAVAASADKGSWSELAPLLKRRMLEERLQQAVHPRLGTITAPWQFRNCGMGGRHTEKEYPESNISMQEAMFLILGAADFQEAQEMTVRLQNRLKEIIEKEEGCRVMGIGLEGGLAPYISRGDYPLPEVRLWALMRQTIEECGYRPGKDVAIALDPALSELEIAYREENNIPDAVGLYLFWRDKAKKVLDRDGVLEIYQQAIRQYNIPILSIEDGFSENDHEGWKKLLAALGDQLFIIGDDLVTTNDRTIEMAAGQALINTALIKANQIGSLYETVIAMLVALGKGLELVVSHRSKSPNDDMEAQIALAANALGLKCGGGANTERLVKYQAVAAMMRRVPDAGSVPALIEGQKALVSKVWGYEEPTNAGIPTVGVEVEMVLPDAGIGLQFRGATPLGTSAGTGEAIHLVDSVIEQAEHREVIDAHPSFFDQVESKVFTFKKGVSADRVRATGDEALARLLDRARRYQGKGCLTAVDNIRQIIAPFFEGRNLTTRTIRDVDRDLLGLELRTARRRGKVDEPVTPERAVQIMQRKQNLGMNALLSVSLALGRAIAHIHGKQLYELLREEMMSLIERLSSNCKVRIEGSQWSDYVHALREANQVLEKQGRPLHIEIRNIAGIYQDTEVPERAPVEAIPAAAGAAAPERLAEPVTLSRPLPAVALAAILSEQEQQEVSATTLELVQGLRDDNQDRRQAALSRLLVTEEKLSTGSRRVEIVNNRLLMVGEQTLVPYRIGDALVVYAARDDKAEALVTGQVAPGAILTDPVVARLAGQDPEAAQVYAIDLEDKLYDFDARNIEEIRIGRIRDIASVLAHVNTCHNIHEADYYLRFLVAGLSSLSYQAFVGAKNLQPEIRQLMDELARLLNGPHGRRLRFVMRVLVRNLSALVLRPNLIDEVWNYSIDLAEVKVRGSAIVNEIRRSCHHALGPRTLRLSRAYLAYLEAGATEPLAELGYEELSPADLEARRGEGPAQLLQRIVDDLEKLIGTSDTVTRIDEWCEAYSESLLRCELGTSLPGELEILVSDGLRGRNRWIYRHRLRIIQQKLRSFALPREADARLSQGLEELSQIDVQDQNLDCEYWSQRARDFGLGLIQTLQALYQDDLLDEVRSVTNACKEESSRACYERIWNLRQTLAGKIERGGFAELRCHLLQLDCLLEELGYLVLRRIVADLEERGVDLQHCFDVIRRSIANLIHDGFISQDLTDLGIMLVNPALTRAELSNVLDQIMRQYHKIMRRATMSYEEMAERLQLGSADLIVLQGNLKRYLHDLNAIAQFCDLARGHVQKQAADPDRPLVPTQQAGAIAPVLHISHREEILRVIADGISLRQEYGGKGSGLLYISLLGIPTRDGFILPTSMVRSRRQGVETAAIDQEILHNLQILEQDIARPKNAPKRFGSTERPLLLAVRGGSVFSMPGILSTVIFIGMNDRIAAALAEHDPWYAYDSYRRFLSTYAEAVWQVDMEAFGLVEEAKGRYGVRFKQELPWEAMREIVTATKGVLQRKGFGAELEATLEDPQQQLFGAARAILASWDAERACRYREIKGLCHSWHTAIIVQEMASGNRRNDFTGDAVDEIQASLTGVIPRSHVTVSGIHDLAGEIKFSAAGDDLVGGLTASDSLQSMADLRRTMPMLYRRLHRIATWLRRFMGTDQEIEFTVERGELSVLQTRMAETAEEKKVANFTAPGKPVARGVGVRGGAFRGLVAFDEAGRREMTALAEAGRDGIDGVLLVLENPTPDDIPLILSADGVLTAKGGSTSHAATAVNTIDTKGFSAVLGARDLRVSAKKSEAVFLGPGREVLHRARAGDVLSIHGTTGEVYAGSLPIVEPGS
jgi:enolase